MSDEYEGWKPKGMKVAWYILAGGLGLVTGTALLLALLEEYLAANYE